jgi:hypothetical protein
VRGEEEQECHEGPLDSQIFINRTFAPALKRAAIGEFRWHDLRHSFASRLLMKGVDIVAVQQLLGHSDIRMTLRHSHLSAAHLHEAVERLADRTSTATSTGDLGAVETEAASSATERIRSENRRATRRNRTGDLLITNCPEDQSTMTQDEPRSGKDDDHEGS